MSVNYSSFIVEANSFRDLFKFTCKGPVIRCNCRRKKNRKNVIVVAITKHDSAIKIGSVADQFFLSMRGFSSPSKPCRTYAQIQQIITIIKNISFVNSHLNRKTNVFRERLIYKF